MGIVLLKLNLVQGDNFAGRVEDEEAGAGGSLVDSADKRLGTDGRHCALGRVLRDEVGKHSGGVCGR